MSARHLIILGLMVLVTAGCSIRRMAARQTTAMVIQAIPAYDRETDLELAEQAIASNLKLLEGLLEGSPRSSSLLVTTSSSFSRYTFGFIEEKIEIADQQYDLVEAARLTDRAVGLYERARKYGLRAIALSRNEFSQALGGDLDQLSSELQHFGQEELPALFWTAFAWGSIINLRQDDPARLVELPRVKLMMTRVLELDEAYFFGGPHIFFGTLFGNLPELLGGNPENARYHLERAIELNEGKYLMAKFLLAKYVAFPAQDRIHFEQVLQDILSAPPDLFPDQGLANQLAKRRAERWVKRADELF